MKKLILLSFLAIFTQLDTLKAQQTQIGFKIGSQVTNFSGDDADNASTDAKVGLFLGGFATFKRESLAFQPELLISNKGANFEDRNDILRLIYLELPLLGKYYINDKFNVHVGPQVGFLVFSEYADDQVKDQFKDLDFGLIGGLEFVSDKGFLVGARYNLGLAAIGEDFEVMEDGITIKQDAADYKNTALQLYLGFGF